MRIAIYSDTFYPQVNGVADVVYHSAITLAERGHDVRLYIPYVRQALPYPEELTNKVGVYHLPSFKFPGYMGERMIVPFGFSLRDIRRFKPDVVHIHTPFIAGWEAVIAARLAKAKLIGTHHTFYDHYLRHIKMDYRPMKKFSWRYTAFFYNRCNIVLSPTRSLAEEMRSYGLRRDIEIIANPIDTGFFLPADKDKKVKIKQEYGIAGKYLVYMGRISYEKNISHLIEAFSLMAKREPDLKLMLVGDGPERSQLEDLSVKLGLAGKIIFTGYLFGRKLSEALEASDAFITLSLSENQPISVLQAMASGLPVVAVAANGMKELIVDGVNGLLLSNDDPKTVAEKTLGLINNKKQLSEFSRLSRELSRGYSLESTAEQVERAYRHALRQKYERVPLFRIS